ncbi:PE-PPE domain-containing protein [Mycolicibacterium thermoresistibile]
MVRWIISALGVTALAWAGVTAVDPVSTAERAAALQLTAARSVIMPGTKIGYIPSEAEFTDYATAVIATTAGAPGAVEYLDVPGQFWPATGLDSLTFDASVRAGQALLSPEVDAAIAGGDAIVVFGHSQSAVIATKEKQRLLAEYGQAETPPDVQFVLAANPNRPNGGLLARFPGLHIPILGVTFNGATPTQGPFDTYDVARQYDGWADFPTYPLNLVATANAVLGIYYLHGGYYDLLAENPEILTDEQLTSTQQYGDTTYYLIKTDRLPLLRPLRELGVPDEFVDALEPYVRHVVELGYDRQTPYGAPTRARLLPPLKPTPAPEPEVVAEPLRAVEPAGRSDAVEKPAAEKPVEKTERPTLIRPRSQTNRPLVRESLRAVTVPQRGGSSIDKPTGQPETTTPQDNSPETQTPDQQESAASESPADDVSD